MSIFKRAFARGLAGAADAWAGNLGVQGGNLARLQQMEDEKRAQDEAARLQAALSAATEEMLPGHLNRSKNPLLGRATPEVGMDPRNDPRVQGIRRLNQTPETVAMAFQLAQQQPQQADPWGNFKEVDGALLEMGPDGRPRVAVPKATPQTKPEVTDAEKLAAEIAQLERMAVQFGEDTATGRFARSKLTELTQGAQDTEKLKDRENRLNAPARLQQMTLPLRQLVEKVKEAKSDKNTRDVVGSIEGRSWWPNTISQANATAASRINNIKDLAQNVGLEMMRAASATGGAVGSVTEREWPKLGARIANLDTIQDEATFMRELSSIESEMTRLITNMETAFSDMYPDAFERPQAVMNDSAAGMAVKNLRQKYGLE